MEPTRTTFNDSREHMHVSIVMKEEQFI